MENQKQQNQPTIPLLDQSTQEVPSIPFNQPLNQRNVPGNPQIMIPQPQEANIEKEPDQAPEFVDALEGVQRPAPAQELVNIPVEEKPVKNRDTDEMVEVDLPEINWLKMNSGYLDGRSPFRQWSCDIYGQVQKSIVPVKSSFEYMLSLGYTFHSCSSIPGPGNYLMMFFVLKPDVPRRAKVPASFIRKK